MALGIHFRRLPIGPHIGTAPAASLADETRLEIGQSDVIGPSIAADRCVVAAAIIGTVDQEAANASGAHFSEGDLLAGQGGHALLKRGEVVTANKKTARRRSDFWRDALSWQASRLDAATRRKRLRERYRELNQAI
jgi:hypothetical protein